MKEKYKYMPPNLAVCYSGQSFKNIIIVVRLDYTMDLSFEKNFILNVMSYVFTKNKVKIPRLLIEIMNESCCSNVYLFPSEVRQAVDVILKSQEQVFKFLTKESIDFYYKRRISSEKVFLEFTTFHSRISLLDTFDNPEAATEIYHSMMDFIAVSKQKRDFTLNQDKLIIESKKIVNQGMNKYINYLIDECQRMHTEATNINSTLPREAYFVTTFEKCKTKIVIGDKTSENKFLDDEKITEVDKGEKVQRHGTIKTQIRETPKTRILKSEKSIAVSVKDPEFVDVELDEAKCVQVYPAEKITVKSLPEIVATEDLETVVMRGNEENLVEQLLEAMEDIL